MTKTTALSIAAILVITMTAGCSTQRPSLAADKHPVSGEVVEYHANGKVKRKAEYLDGQLVSVNSYYANGSTEFNEQYQSGEIHSGTYFFTSGRVKAEIIAE
jgi:hypothetical protein